MLFPVLISTKEYVTKEGILQIQGNFSIACCLAIMVTLDTIMEFLSCNCCLLLKTLQMQWLGPVGGKVGNPG